MLTPPQVGFFLTTRFLLYVEVAPQAWFYFFLAGTVGIVTSYLLVIITQRYTDYAYPSVQGIAQASTTGHATNIIAGFAVGMESTALPVVVIAFSLITSYSLGANSGLPSVTAGTADWPRRASREQASLAPHRRRWACWVLLCSFCL